MSARTRRIALAVLAACALAGCDTQPPTDVTDSAATLNGKGACSAGISGTWWYQLRNTSAGGGFGDVGPGHTFGCASNTGEVALESYRVGGLRASTVYHFRIRSQLTNGQTLYFDGNGTNGGGAYDGFLTLPDQRSANGGVVGASDEASAAVSADRLCNWRLETDLDTRSSDSNAWVRAKASCGTNRSVWQTCEATIWDGATGWAIYSGVHHGTNACNAFRRSGCADWCETAKGSQGRFWFRLNNPDRRWTGGFVRGDQIYCDFRRNASNQHIMGCLWWKGNPPIGCQYPVDETCRPINTAMASSTPAFRAALKKALWRGFM
jgi:hypothetical protein